MTGLRPLLLGLALVLIVAATVFRAAAAAHAQRLRFVPASPALLAQCAATARAVGYPTPCPALVPARLIGSGGPTASSRSSAGNRCPNAAVSRRGWVVGLSGTDQDEHLVLTASLPGV